MFLRSDDKRAYAVSATNAAKRIATPILPSLQLTTARVLHIIRQINAAIRRDMRLQFGREVLLSSHYAKAVKHASCEPATKCLHDLRDHCCEVLGAIGVLAETKPPISSDKRRPSLPSLVLGRSDKSGTSLSRHSRKPAQEKATTAITSTQGHGSWSRY